MKGKFAVACGGTGGHMFPGLAVAAELLKRGHEVTVWKSGRDVEGSVMKGWEGPVFSTGARPLGLRNAIANVLSFFRCVRELKRWRPDALLAMGSYSSLQPVAAARLTGTKIVLHEANTVPGGAISFLSRYADAAAVSFEETKARLPRCATELTGLPVRSGVAGCEPFAEIPRDAFCVFVTGGSQGAHALNMLAKEALPEVARRLGEGASRKKLFVIHQTGAADEAEVRAAYGAARVPARVCAFEHEMGRAYASADLVVCRAGASTLFELALAGKAAFLVPLPSAKGNHQHFNAQAFVRKNAAAEGDQGKITAETLADYVFNKLMCPESLARTAAAAAGMAVPDAAARVADMVERIGFAKKR